MVQALAISLPAMLVQSLEIELVLLYEYVREVIRLTPPFVLQICSRGIARPYHFESIHVQGAFRQFLVDEYLHIKHMLVVRFPLLRENALDP